MVMNNIMVCEIRKIANIGFQLVGNHQCNSNWNSPETDAVQSPSVLDTDKIGCQKQKPILEKLILALACPKTCARKFLPLLGLDQYLGLVNVETTLKPGNSNTFCYSETPKNWNLQATKATCPSPFFRKIRRHRSNLQKGRFWEFLWSSYPFFAILKYYEVLYHWLQKVLVASLNKKRGYFSSTPNCSHSSDCSISPGQRD